MKRGDATGMRNRGELSGGGRTSPDASDGHQQRQHHRGLLKHIVSHEMFIPGVHAFIVTFVGLGVLIWDAFYNSAPPNTIISSISTMLSWISSPATSGFSSYKYLFVLSIVYFIWDSFHMLRMKDRSNFIKFGFVFHHIACILGITGPVLSTPHQGQDSRVILLCFSLAESANVIRAIGAVLLRIHQEASQFEHETALERRRFMEKLEFSYLTAFIVTRVICFRVVFSFVLTGKYESLWTTKLTSLLLLVYTIISGREVARNPAVAFTS
eukprot:TRINITY_DN38288_c0_g1_i1.p1 TRINITY_DN38288_c0_g1~~TRINITY_DN38288_c0_g1_i1.p1  ORF type:complete len:269 (+),score=57.16 TRINITY_DN38288_c0_g1_i1:123-929(+)